MSSRLPNVRLFLSAIAISILALLFTLLPATSPLVYGTSKLLGGSELTDAAGHVVLMAALTYSWYAALCGRYTWRDALLIGVFISLGLGTTTELAQAGIAERGASVLDLGANTLGVALASVCIRSKNR